MDDISREPSVELPQEVRARSKGPADALDPVGGVVDEAALERGVTTPDVVEVPRVIGDAEERLPDDREVDPTPSDEVVDAVGADATPPESEDHSTDEPQAAKPAEDEDEVPELSDPDEIARVVLALLLTQREGATVLRLAEVCRASQKDVKAGVERLRDILTEDGLPLEVSITGERIKLLTRPEVFPYIKRFKGIKRQTQLSPAALETLAVIAYRQPVIRAEIESIRGVKAGPMLRTLLEHKLVKVTGRADVPGRPLQYGTTQQFLERFGLESLKELPSVDEFKNLG